MKRVLGILTSLIIVAGCATPRPDDPKYAPVAPVEPTHYQSGQGSLYHPGTAITLFEDIRARRVGDMLTVVLNEGDAATRDGESNINKSTDTTITNPTILGSTPQFNAPGILPLASNKRNTLDFDLNSDNKLKGDYGIKQNNTVTGNITVTVTQVLSNGNLKIRGEKWITLAGGKEYVRVMGIVRPRDITPDNKVSSQRIADARIEYSGTGTASNSLKSGWLSKFFVTAFWPF